MEANNLADRFSSQITEDLQTLEEAHEAWVASLPDHVAAPLTEEEKEREAMIERRSQYFEKLMKENGINC